ncbi:MAG: hypothetical protein AAGK02_11225 [Pseudomonadota bacterium]
MALAQSVFADAYPDFAWNRDWTIVALSAEFTIALIPIVWILVFARPFARWMVTAFGLWKLYGLVGFAFEAFRYRIWPHPSVTTELALVLVSLVLLFTRSANRYFASNGEMHVQKG